MSRVPLAADERRFRGVFGSPEFLKVYPDTISNVNRKRSSQVFRIAFCETLANNTDELSHSHAVRSSIQDDHGDSADCLGCHRRLDPMARFFDQWIPPVIDGRFAEYDPNRPSFGIVYLGGKSGMSREYAGVGDSDLGAIVVRQPEFSACVANLAWHYVFGRDVPLDETTSKRLTSRFDATKRFNTLVKEVLLHPYFWSDLQPPPINYANIRPMLQDCGGCHARSAGTRFDPATYPFKSEAVVNFELVKRLWGAVNHSPGFRPMPEGDRPKLSSEDLDFMRSWLASGAHDESGLRTLSDDQIEEILR